jgi:NADH-quinone oxidoreductase subunit H
MKLAMMLMAEYFLLVVGSFLMVTLFWGGWHLPWVGEIGNPVVAAVVKLLVLVGKMGLFVLLALIVRWTIPRFRFDQLMNLAWKVMLPLALLNLLCVMVVKQLDAPLVVLTAASVVLFLGAGLMSVRTRGSVTNPKRPVRKLPPGLPPGVTYAGR